MSTKFKEAVAVWKEDLAFEATANSGFAVRLDGDSKTGFSPMEMVLIGLAGCTGADVVEILRKKRQKVTALEVRVHGDRSAEHPRKYTHIQVTFVVTGHEVDPQAVERAIELSQTKYCSVTATLRGVAKITNRFEIREAEAEAKSAVW